MRRFLFEALVDALILLALAFLLSLIHVPQPFPFGSERVPIVARTEAGFLAFFVFAMVLGAVNRAVRPVIVAFTGRLVLATAGLFMVVITWLVFQVTSFFAPDLVVIADPRWLWALAISGLYGLVSIVLDAVLGLSRPSLDVEGRGKFIWRFLDGLPTPRRNAIIENLRFQQVYDTLYRYGLDIFLAARPSGGSAPGSSA